MVTRNRRNTDAVDDRIKAFQAAKAPRSATPTAEDVSIARLGDDERYEAMKDLRAEMD